MEEALKRRQREASTEDRMLSDTVGPEEIATVVSKWTGVPVNKLQARPIYPDTGPMMCRRRLAGLAS